MTSFRRSSAIEELDVARFGGPTSMIEVDVLVGVTETELVKPNPDRLMLIVANNGTSGINLSTTSPVTLTRGLPLGEGSLIVFSAFDDGVFVGRRLYAIAQAAATPITVIEVERAHRL